MRGQDKEDVMHLEKGGNACDDSQFLMELIPQLEATHLKLKSLRRLEAFH